MSRPVHLDLRGDAPDAAALAPAADHLRSGGIVACPTETVYGFSGLCSPESVARVRALKRREAHRPLLLLVRGVEDVRGLVWSDEARELAAVFWPGALTLVLADPLRIFPDGVRSAAGAVAVRVSPHPFVETLLGLVQAPLTSTSANAPGGVPARSGAEVMELVAELGYGEEILVVDGGTLPESGPSTIVDCTGPVPTVIRQGTVPVSRLRCALPEIR